jgi:hypothetical protein
MGSTLSTLYPYILSRCDETVESGPVFWTQNEIYSAAMEAMCDLLLLVGRPDMIVSVPFEVQPNTPFQDVPKGVFAVTGLQGPVSEVWKVTLQDLDGAQVAGPDWEQDIGDSITSWAPLGFTKFIVHPSVAQAQTVLLTGIASPVTGIWPYNGSESVPFHSEFFQAIEKYAAHYLQFKAGGGDFKASMADYESYMADAKRMTALEDRRDPFIFSGSIGSQIVANPTKTR